MTGLAAEPVLGVACTAHLAALLRRQQVAQRRFRQGEGDVDRVELGDGGERSGQLHQAARVDVDGADPARSSARGWRCSWPSTPDERSAAWSALSSARAESTWLFRVSTALCARNFCATSSWLRLYWRSTSASAAWSRAIWALALSTLAASLRSSSENISSPVLTNWPSLMCTVRMVRGGLRMQVDGADSGVTVPFDCRATGTSWRSGVTTLTTVGGWAAPSWRRRQRRRAEAIGRAVQVPGSGADDGEGGGDDANRWFFHAVSWPLAGGGVVIEFGLDRVARTVGRKRVGIVAHVISVVTIQADECSYICNVRASSGFRQHQGHFEATFGWLISEMVPPCCSAMLRAMVKPRPVPPDSREREVSTR